MEIFFEKAPEYSSLAEKCRELSSTGFFTLSTIGRSFLGKELFALSHGAPENCTLLVGGVHGSEWITTLLLLQFAQELAHIPPGSERDFGGISLPRALTGRPFTIIPCLNPDGTAIAVFGPEAGLCQGEGIQQLLEANPGAVWQANARGVDLNHNFDAGWKLLRKMEQQQGITGPAPGKYGGPGPESEPESSAVVRFCRKYRPRQLYAYHSQGEEIYYQYGNNTPGRASLIASLLAASCGYTVCKPEGTASHGGLKDWFIEEFARPGFTLEVGRGKNPLPAGDLPAIYRKLREAMALSLVL